MWQTEAFDYWWLIPLILIGLCIIWGKGCCFRRRTRIEDGRESVHEASSDSALEILSKLYVHGEIDDEEYERKRRKITLAKKGEPR